ncbi:MAG: N-acetylmuramoyl-L-alanine amidase [Rhodospirillales bacterium]|nr:N-acetylmuramoyl-L-alanine amidase [Rhodospirillales bacterium]
MSPAARTVDMIVLHTRFGAEAATRAALAAPGGGFSAHYLVGGDGTIWQLAEEEVPARHAGPAFWRGHTALDDRAIGIALAHAGPERAGVEYPVMQLASACDLCLHILSRHPVPARNIVGHADIAPDRASDPGEGFDWEGLARNGVGLWPAGAPDLGTGAAVRDAASLRDVRAALAAIGYRVAPDGALDPALSAVLRAFQRHWRPEAVTGQADAGTLARLLAVARLCG